MSQISDEIIELIDKNRLDDLKKIKDQMTEKDYNQSVYNIIASKDTDSQELEKILNQIKDPTALSKVISALKNNVAKNANTSIVKDGTIDISELAGQINDLQTKYEANEMNQNRGTVVGETVITAATLHSMLENYENLTPEQQREVTRQVIENLDETIQNLTQEAKKELEDRGLLESINKIKKPLEEISRLQELARKKNRTPKEEEEFKRLSNEHPEFFDEKGKFDDKKAEEFKKEVLPVLEECDNFIKSLPTNTIDWSDEQLHKIDEWDKTFEDIYKKYGFNEKVNEHLKKTSDEFAEIKGRAVNLDLDPEKKNEQDKINSMGENKSTSEEDTQKFVEEQQNQNEENISALSTLEEIEQEQSPNTVAKNDFSQEIEQLPNTLVTAEMSQEQIKNALNIYRNYIADFSDYDESTINQIKGLSTSEIIDNFLDDFNDLRKNGEINDETFKMLKIISSVTFNGNIHQILTNTQTREAFLEQFDQILSQDISQAKDVELTGELGEIVGQYLSEKEATKEQPAPSFNQDTIKDELAAIPVALSNIEGIDKKDIIAGMQGYKQLLDSIDVNSLQGMSNEDILNMLSSKVSNIGLEGNANAILLMMSQIGFSENGNKQIASILAESKDAFVALVDEASKEENINKSIQKSKENEKISDREATPGMQALIVDLKVAKQNENQLGNQVISDDESSATSATDSDTTTATTTNKKELNPQNMFGLIGNTRLSDVIIAQEETKEVINGEKEENRQDNENKNKQGQEFGD